MLWSTSNGAKFVHGSAKKRNSLEMNTGEKCLVDWRNNVYARPIAYVDYQSKRRQLELEELASKYALLCTFSTPEPSDVTGMEKTISLVQKGNALALRIVIDSVLPSLLDLACATVMQQGKTCRLLFDQQYLFSPYQ